MINKKKDQYKGEINMKRIFLILFILAILSTNFIYADDTITHTNIVAEGHEYNVDYKEITPMYKIYCQESPNGKHYYLREGQNYSLTLRNSSGDDVDTWWGIPSKCEYCGDQIWVDFYYEEYIHISDINCSPSGNCWAYEHDVETVLDEAMEF